jgi:hypothetical protein
LPFYSDRQHEFLKESPGMAEIDFFFRVSGTSGTPVTQAIPLESMFNPPTPEPPDAVYKGSSLMRLFYEADSSVLHSEQTESFWGSGLTYNRSGLSGGTVTSYDINALAYDPAGGPGSFFGYADAILDGISLSASELGAALRSASREDDLAIFRAALSGDDDIVYNVANDDVAYDGHDAPRFSVRSYGGDDVITSYN